eukprot:25027-Chlamydomonas_euryale.AAC.3
MQSCMHASERIRVRDRAKWSGLNLDMPVFYMHRTRVFYTCEACCYDQFSSLHVWRASVGPTWHASMVMSQGRDSVGKPLNSWPTLPHLLGVAVRPFPGSSISFGLVPADAVRAYCVCTSQFINNALFASASTILSAEVEAFKGASGDTSPNEMLRTELAASMEASRDALCGIPGSAGTGAVRVRGFGNLRDLEG